MRGVEWNKHELLDIELYPYSDIYSKDKNWSTKFLTISPPPLRSKLWQIA